MGLAYQPSFKLVADSNDITDVISRNLLNLTLTDNAGSESDRLVLSVALPESIETPKTGAVLALSLGFIDKLVDKGKFVVDEVTSSGPPRVVQIVANAAPMDNRKQSASLQTQKTRSFDDVTLGDLLRTLASEHGLQPKVSSDLDGIALPHVDQVAESDMNLMTRLAKRYGAISKPANGFWLLLVDGEGKSASGKSLPELTLTPNQVSTWQCRFTSRNDAKKVVATYHDVETGETKEVSTGSGEPAQKIVFKYANIDEATAAVQARAKTLKSSSKSLDITMPASINDLSTVAEGYLNLSGFGSSEDGKWRLKTIEWSLSNQGLQLRLRADSSVGEK